MFQALAQNTDLKERLRRIHAESMLLDPPAAPKSGDNLAEVGRFLSGNCSLHLLPTHPQHSLSSCIAPCFTPLSGDHAASLRWPLPQPNSG